MGLDITITKKKDYSYTVDLKGSIDTETHDQLEDELREIIDENTRAVVLNMSGVSYLSSIGIRVIIWAQKELTKRNATFGMVDLQPQITKIFEVMKILPLVNIFDDMEEADKYIDQIIQEEIKKQGS
ncbi:MAG: STAS domain-containing protein [Candidatus Omnitrophota bacterium]